jgi:SAM-dependent methyltransferase
MSKIVTEKRAPRTEPLDRCPVCESNETRFFFSSPDRLHGVPGEFSYHVCRKCHTVFQNPMVTQEDLYLCYPEEYSPYNLRQEIPNIDLDNLPNGNLRNNLRKAIVGAVKGKPTAGAFGTIGQVLAKSSFLRERAFYGLVVDECLPRGEHRHFALDLGCGSGWLVERLQRVGWQAEGIEWNEEAAKLASKVTGCKIWAGDFRMLDLPKEKYHLIVLNHVFEHINDTQATLDRVHNLLVPGGTAALYYPNSRALGTSWYKTRWFHWDAPRHLIFPSPIAIKSLADKIGYSRVEVFSKAHNAAVNWAYSKAHKLGKDPLKTNSRLNLAEWAGVVFEVILTKLGFNKGWETVVLLKK